ncbi:putative transcription factor MADS-type1 family [Arabidopsis thaliana]
MGRVKIQIKRINDRQQRNIAFAKRKNGLLKKAYELFVLCNVPVALILFSPSGKLFVFYAKERPEEIICKFLARAVRTRLPHEPNIQRLVMQMRSETKCSDESLDDGLRYLIQPKIEDEIEEVNARLAEVEKQLERFLEIPDQWESLAELKRREEDFQKTLDIVQSRKRDLKPGNFVSGIKKFLRI